MSGTTMELLSDPTYSGIISNTPSGRAYSVSPGQVVAVDALDVRFLIDRFGFVQGAPRSGATISDGVNTSYNSSTVVFPGATVSDDGLGITTVALPGGSGTVGPAGPEGPPGPAGQDGAQGPVGPAGPAGPTGSAGAAGPAGSDGAPGAQGSVGPAGPQGPAGPTGNTGPQGPQGTPGATGATGTQGIQGPAGNTGAQGTVGPAGPSAVSANAGNLAALGTDGLVLVQTDPSRAPIRGTVLADNAAAGNIGEQLAASQTTAISLTTAVTANIATIALTPGDWSVSGVVVFTPSAAPSALAAAIGSTSATLPTAAQVATGTGNMTQYRLTFTSAQPQTMQTGITRVNVSATTNVYLTAQGTFASGTLTATGYISARRVR